MRTWYRASLTYVSAVSILLILVLCAPVSALDPDRPFNQYMINFWQESSGLPQKHVTTIMQTRDGYIWVGTKGGLARFDGISFTVYDDKHPNQLKDAEVWAILEENDGALLVGTYGGGVSRFKDGKFTNYSTGDGLPNNSVTSMCMGKDGSAWIGTLGGLACLRGSNLTTYKVGDGFPGKAVLSLHCDSDGIIWIGTDRGLASFSEGKLTNHTIKHPKELDAPVGAITGNAKDGLWLGMCESILGYGMRRIKDGVITSYYIKDGLPSDTVTSILVDKSGVVWIATRGGLCRFRNNRFERYYGEVLSIDSQQRLEAVSLRNIQTIFLDREGNLWVGTTFDGLARFRDALFLNINGGEAGGDGLNIHSVFEDSKGNMWMGTGNGLTQINGESIIKYRLPNGLPVESIAEDRDGALWLGTASGIYSLISGKVTPSKLTELEKTSIAVLFVDSKGDLWIGARSNGLYQYSAGKLRHYTPADGLAGDQVRGIAVDSHGGLWVCSKNGGVSCLRDGRFTTFGSSKGLPDDSGQAIFVDREDTVWVSTRRGLARIRDNVAAAITTQNGLPANFFNQIIADDNDNLWLSYGQGIVRTSRQALNEVADGKAQMVEAVKYGAENGMWSTAMTVANQPVIWKTRKGQLWFATMGGVAVIDPNSIINNPLPPPVHITGIRVDLREQPLQDGIAFAPGTGDIQISYTGLCYVAPDRVRFKYMLEGFDHDWIEAGARRVAYYTNLAPNKYRFRVMACNNDGVWNETDAAFSFTLRPHFYQTYWFYGLCVLLAGAMFALSIHFRIRQHVAKEKELARRVNEALANIKRLHGLLPICASCKKIRDDKGYWGQLETYIRDHSDVDFSHSICPDCMDRLYPDVAKSMKNIDEENGHT